MYRGKAAMVPKDLFPVVEQNRMGRTQQDSSSDIQEPISGKARACQSPPISMNPYCNRSWLSSHHRTASTPTFTGQTMQALESRHLPPRTPPSSISRPHGLWSPPEPNRLSFDESNRVLQPTPRAAATNTNMHEYRKKDQAESLLKGDKVMDHPNGRLNSIFSLRSCHMRLADTQVIGHASLQIYKLKLPTYLLPRLDEIVQGAEGYSTRLPDGWKTDLYSLTKQDLALMDIPGMMEVAQPIVDYVHYAICCLYYATSIHMDRNQPHVLKYSGDHKGVMLHHDRCDVTANIMLSRKNSYVGGGTFLQDANTVVRLAFGEFLLHPGKLVHGGLDIESGSRYLMVLFAHLIH